MPTAKQKLAEVLRAQPEDATYDEIMRELALEKMIARGLEDSRMGRVSTNEEMKRRMESWRK